MALPQKILIVTLKSSTKKKKMLFMPVTVGNVFLKAKNEEKIKKNVFVLFRSKTVLAIFGKL